MKKITFTYTHSRMLRCIHTILHRYIHRHVYTYIHAYIHIYIHTYTHTNIYTYIHTYIHTHVHTYMHTYIHIHIYIYRVSQEEWTKLRESVSYVKIYRYNPKYLYPKLNGYGDNGHRKVWTSVVSTYCKPSVTPYSSTAHARQRETTS